MPPESLVVISASSSSMMSAEAQTAPPSPQAPPLPRKRGEIGYREEIHGPAVDSVIDEENWASVLPSRHPADRDPIPPTPNGETTTMPTSSNSTGAANSFNPSSSTDALGKRSIISFFRPKPLPLFFGMRLVTLFIVTAQLILLAGTIASWAIFINHGTSQNNTSQSQSGDSSNSLSSGSAKVFVYILFVMAVLGQLLLFERRVFLLRAERYAHLHPGEMLPSHRGNNSAGAPMPFAPWNRPPLPTYAATLAASGYGTGDVDDHIIAAPAPPAYGNTRDSTLLLTGLPLRDADTSANSQHVGSRSRPSTRA